MARKKGQRVDQAETLFDRKLSPGDMVLLGGTFASYPGLWYLGKILWVGGEDILVERYTLNGATYRQQATIYAIRAIGNLSELNEIQEAARKAVKHLRDDVSRAEQALDDARAALHSKLEELHQGGLKHIPFDREASESKDREERAVNETLDEENARQFEAQGV